MAEDYARIFAENGAKTTINDTDYGDGWVFIGDNPPEREDFNSVMNEQDLKLADLNTRLINGGASSWVNFDGTGAPSVTASFNVSSITDNGIGDYTVNLTTPTPTALKTVVTSTIAATSTVSSIATNQFRVITLDSTGSPTDPSVVCAAEFGGN